MNEVLKSLLGIVILIILFVGVSIIFYRLKKVEKEVKNKESFKNLQKLLLLGNIAFWVYLILNFLAIVFSLIVFVKYIIN